MDMDSLNRKERDEIFAQAVKAGKRTYFFDVKETKTGERYLTITESKKCFNADQGNFYYEKHKIFLYNEDIEKFIGGLNTAAHFIQTGEAPKQPKSEDSTSSLDKEDSIDFDMNWDD